MSAPPKDIAAEAIQAHAAMTEEERLEAAERFIARGEHEAAHAALGTNGRPSWELPQGAPGRSNHAGGAGAGPRPSTGSRQSLADRMRESSHRLAELAENGVPEVEYVGAPFAYGLFYAGATNVLAGNFETFKTTLALHSGIEYLRRGGTLVEFDWEGGEADTLSRMFALGASADELRGWIEAGRFLWEYSPSIDLLDPEQAAELSELLTREGKPPLVVWDSWIALLRRHGGDENDANTSRDVIDALNAQSEASGASQVIIAHRGLNTKKWVASRGSTALEDGTFGAYRVEKTAHEDDHATLELHRIKNRRGGLWTRHDVHVELAEGSMRPMRLRAAESDSPYGRAWRAAHEYLEAKPDEWVTFTDLRSAIPHDEPLVRIVLDHAAEDPGSPIEQRKTEQGKRTYYHYRYSTTAAEAAPSLASSEGAAF